VIEHFHETVGELAELEGELKGAVDRGDGAATERLLAQMAVLERRRNRLVHQTLTEEGATLDPTLPIRDQVLTSLRMLTRPSAARLIVDVARARFGENLPPGRLASLRRDDERSYQRAPGSRPAYLVPALSHDRLAPVRGLVALSSWPLEVRIIAPASPRVDMLHALAALIDTSEKHKETAWARSLERILWRLARTVPDAVDPRSDLDLGRARNAVAVELAELADEDGAERLEAAARARGQLDDHGQLFGVRMHVVDGEMGEERAAG
jgi:hypothetical protein